MRRTRENRGEAVVSWEEAGECTRRAPRGRGPSTYARIAEITPGRAISQQGLTATCEDQLTEGKLEAAGGIWSGAWASRSDEGGAMPSEVALDATLARVTPESGKGALGTWRFLGRSRTQSRGCRCPQSRDELVSKPVMGGVHVSQRLSLSASGQAHEGKPRSEPDSGNPTVRDRRGAPGNVAMGAGLRPMVKAMELSPDPEVRAPGLYPDLRPQKNPLRPGDPGGGRTPAAGARWCSAP